MYTQNPLRVILHFDNRLTALYRRQPLLPLFNFGHRFVYARRKDKREDKGTEKSKQSVKRCSNLERKVYAINRRRNGHELRQIQNREMSVTVVYRPTRVSDVTSARWRCCRHCAIADASHHAIRVSNAGLFLCVCARVCVLVFSWLLTNRVAGCAETVFTDNLYIGPLGT